MAFPRSHQIFSASLQESLTPVEITVHVEVNLLGEPPKADILLLRREGERWSAAQRARLPDGVRENAAGHVLVEFKYTESVNPKALAQAVAYDFFYLQGQRLRKDQVQTVVLSARTPRRRRLEIWGYEEVQKGVFRGPPPVLDRVWLLVLNELPAAPHNAFVKLFASSIEEREAAFAALDVLSLVEPPSLQDYIFGLRQVLGKKGDYEMAEALTPEKVREIGEQVRRRAIESASPEELDQSLRKRILESASLEERLEGMTPSERRALLQLLQEEMKAGSPQARNGDDDVA